eukprot:SM000058S18475  [mRNA]  locus=s58:164541:166293:+ [translate_table: standard]
MAPSWDSLAEMVPSEAVAAHWARVPAAKERRFEAPEGGEPRVVLYRDNSAWCPYCERVWLQLEEKRVPYRVEKVAMRCYGDKPAWYTQMVPSGLLPAVHLDGQLITESLDIMLALEQELSDCKPLLPQPGTQEAARVSDLLRLERQLFGAWLQWLTSPWGSRQKFEATMDAVDEALAATGGPYFLGKEFSLVDAVFAPFLERIAPSIAYWKGLVVRGSGRWPHLDQWFAAMDGRPAYKAVKSDDFGICHNLEPQIGRCAPLPDGKAYRAMVDGKDGSWDLPLQEEATTWGRDDGSGAGGAREEAAAALCENHEAIVGFALRGVRDGEQFRKEVDAGLRSVVLALLKGPDAVASTRAGLPKQVAVAAAYLRDRVGVPRDMAYPAARQLRAHLQHLVQDLGSNL